LQLPRKILIARIGLGTKTRSQIRVTQERGGGGGAQLEKIPVFSHVSADEPRGQLFFWL